MRSAAIVAHLRREREQCRAALRDALTEALAAAKAETRDDDEILGHLLDALMALGEARGFSNAAHDITHGEIPSPPRKRTPRKPRGRNVSKGSRR